MWDEKFPKKYNGKKKQHFATAHDQDEMYYDEEGNVKHKSSQHMLSTQKGKQELVIKFEYSKNSPVTGWGGLSETSNIKMSKDVKKSKRCQQTVNYI